MPSQGLRACGKFCHLVSSFCGPILRILCSFITISLILCQIRVIGL